MGLVSLDTARCANCQSNNVLLQSTFEWPESDPRWTRKGDPPQAVSCPDCKHVYMIQSLQQGSVQVSQEHLEGRAKVHVVILVALKCDDADCGTRLIALAPRISGTLIADVEKELSSWTLHDLSCPSGHPISASRLRE